MVECQNNSYREHYEQNALEYEVENDRFKLIQSIKHYEQN